MQNSKSGALLWGLDLKYRNQIRKTAAGLGQSEELPGRGRGSPFAAGTSLLSITLWARRSLGPGQTDHWWHFSCIRWQKEVCTGRSERTVTGGDPEGSQNLSDSGLSTRPGRTGGQCIFVAHTHRMFSLLTQSISVDRLLLLSSFSISAFLHSEPPLFPSVILSLHLFLIADCFRTSPSVPLLPHHTALQPWLTTTQLSAPLLTDGSDCCLLSERFYTDAVLPQLKKKYIRSPITYLVLIFLKNMFWRLLYVSIVPSSSFSWLQSFSVHGWSTIYLTGLYWWLLGLFIIICYYKQCCPAHEPFCLCGSIFME